MAAAASVGKTNAYCLGEVRINDNQILLVWFDWCLCQHSTNQIKIRLYMCLCWVLHIACNLLPTIYISLRQAQSNLVLLSLIS
jgi:hypothetical protein